MRDAPRPWSEEETQTLLRMKAEGASRRLIAEHLDRPLGSVKSRIRLIGLTPGQLAERRAAIVASDAARKSRYRDSLVLIINSGPSQAQIAERDLRLSRPMTLSQIYFGDPLPGQSALDKRVGA